MRSPDVHASGRATRGSGVPGLPTVLLMSLLDCAGAIGTASTSVVAIDKGRTSGSSGQPSSNDHAGEEGLLAFGRQGHPIGHFGVDLIVGALLHLCCPFRSELASCHEEEFAALIASNTCDLVPRPVGSNIVTDK
jgi:hypothetical protein